MQYQFCTTYTATLILWSALPAAIRAVFVCTSIEDRNYMYTRQQIYFEYDLVNYSFNVFDMMQYSDDILVLNFNEISRKWLL